jgi:hypothetical protein
VDTAGQTAVGDAWWTWSEKESGTSRAGARRRAAHWYDMALGAATGLTKIRLEKRMAELGIPTEPDLLTLIDLSRDKVHGDWAFDGKALTCMRGQYPSRVQLPYEPPAEYDLTLVVERIEGQAGVMIGCVRESAQFYVAIDDHAGSWSGISNVDGKASNGNETSVPGLLLTNKKTATIVCMVRRDEIGVTVDGKKVISFKGGNERLSNNQAFTVPNRRALFVGTGNARYVFSKMLVKPVSGRGIVRTEPSTFDPVGTWVKQGTGTEFVFKAGGVLEGPKSTDRQYQTGSWERIKETIVLSFPNGERIELRIMDGANLGGTWTLKRK